MNVNIAFERTLGPLSVLRAGWGTRGASKLLCIVMLVCICFLAGCQSGTFGDLSESKDSPDGQVRCLVYYDKDLLAGNVVLQDRHSDWKEEIAVASGGGPVKARWLGPKELELLYSRGSGLRCPRTLIPVAGDQDGRGLVRVELGTYVW